MRRVVGVMAAVLALAACEDNTVVVVGDAPAPPRELAAWYYAGVVNVTWELAPDWNGESFRVYARRVTDADFFLIAEVTSCSEGVCAYRDRNVVPGVTYEYYVAAADPDSGVETASDYSVEVFVPQPIPPPVPTGLAVVALDNANYLRWADNGRAADDFSFYRVYVDDGAGGEFLLGETDSEGFLDRLAANGETYRYFVSAVDDQGHESEASRTASGTPRPDFHGEYLYAFSDAPDQSGFRFQEDEETNPVLAGTDPGRHFRLEVDNAGWWLVPGPDAAVYPAAFETTALKCGPAADAGCVDVTRAPASGYTSQDVELLAQNSYVLRVRGDDGRVHFAVIRVVMQGYDQDGSALMIFDWAYQLQPDNPDLVAAAR
ncbi:MAG: fibronectin type III domain-containing protein [Gemmatimonadota bacterium]